MKKFLLSCAGVAVLVGLLPGVAAADHDDGVYEMPARAIWDTAELDVLIVPPNHGQLYNQDKGALNGGDPNELTPFNTYLKAIEASIAEWHKGVQMFGSDLLKESFATNLYVLGRDTVPPAVLMDPDIVLVTDETKLAVLGFALYTEPCIVNNSKMMIYSFSYADMYNVNGQEFGHCLGLGHVGSQGGVDPTSDAKHPEHDVMNGFYTHAIGAKGNHLHCVSNLNVRGLDFVFSDLSGRGAPGIVYATVDEYGTTCDPPPPPPRKRRSRK